LTCFEGKQQQQQQQQPPPLILTVQFKIQILGLGTILEPFFGSKLSIVLLPLHCFKNILSSCFDFSADFSQWASEARTPPLHKNITEIQFVPPPAAAARPAPPSARSLLPTVLSLLMSAFHT
jgi:hypothetical protein